MLNQSDPILERTKRAYLAYLEKLTQCKLKKESLSGLDLEIELRDTLTMLELINVEINKRKKDE